MLEVEIKSNKVAVLEESLVGWVVTGRRPFEIRLSINFVTRLFLWYSSKLTFKSPSRKMSLAFLKFLSEFMSPIILSINSIESGMEAS